MIVNLTRRFVVKLLALGAFFGFGKKRLQAAATKALIETEQIDQWDKTHDRVWIGGEFWTNPMEDWRINDGWVQCQTTAGNRSIHSVTRQLTDTGAGFAMSVELSESAPIKNNGGAGFRIGVRSDLNEYRSNCFAKNGINAGGVGNQLLLGRGRKALSKPVKKSHVILKLVGAPQGDRYLLKLTAVDAASGGEIGQISLKVSSSAIAGNIALVSQYEGPQRRFAIPGYRFRNWQVGGAAIKHNKQQAFGPLLRTM